MGSYLNVDPIVLMTLAGMALGFATGGTIKGGGAQVGLRIPIGAGGVGQAELGVNPIVHMSSERLPFSLDGITLGGATVAVEPYRWAEINGRMYSPEGYWKKVTDYEYGHVPGWSHFGFEYPLRALGESMKYDPASPLVSKSVHTTRRAIDPQGLNPRHFTLRLVLDAAAKEVQRGNRK